MTIAFFLSGNSKGSTLFSFDPGIGRRAANKEATGLVVGGGQCRVKSVCRSKAVKKLMSGGEATLQTHRWCCFRRFDDAESDLLRKITGGRSRGITAKNHRRIPHGPTPPARAQEK